MRLFVLAIVTSLALAASFDPPDVRGDEGLRSELRLTAPAGSGEGRSGNARFRRGDLAEAARKYEQGLAQSGEAGPARSGLLNNLGTVRLQEDDVRAARAAFEQAMAAATTSTERARAAYNAGNAAAMAGDLESALRHYRTALLDRPDFEDARHNFEVVARHRLQRPGQPDPDEGDEEISDEPADGDPGGEDGSARPGDDPEDGGDELDDGNEGDRREPGRDSPGETGEGQGDDGEADSDGHGDGDGSDGAEGAGEGHRGGITPEEADRILRAIEADEENVMRDMQRRRARERPHERDW